MDAVARIDQALEATLARFDGRDCPPGLAAAVRYSLFPGGARIRPKLCLAVARACGEDEPAITNAAAVAIELLHCASLVHDDLPCFDDAATRRGKPSVHLAYGEPLAVLTGDALIVMAFQVLARGVVTVPERLGELVAIIGRAVGMPGGIVAGQAWECEPQVDLALYHQAKTGALFAGATLAGAAATGAEAGPWGTLGRRLGEAFQVADDLRDVAGDPDEIGKPVGRDQALGRSSAVKELGVDAAVERLEWLVEEALASIPTCPGAVQLRAQIRLEAGRFLPEKLQRIAA